MDKALLKSKMIRSLTSEETEDTHIYRGYIVDPADDANFTSDDEVDEFLTTLEPFKFTA